ncbi:N-acetyltransferase [Streptomyces sanyensis]|uniref:N-acetyltransferase n=1 Tax=Streptomyces sanyensis TaxID=568869 RepID=UPI003D76EC1E
MDLMITTLAERPELRPLLWEMPDTWESFIGEDPVGWPNIGRIMAELPEYVLVATDGPEGPVVAKAFSVPFVLDMDGRRELPDRGWDQVVLWAFSDLRHGRRPDTVSAVEITVSSDHLGRGISGRMLHALRELVRGRGFAQLVAPVRPSAKSAEPEAVMAEYAFRKRDGDGLPHDPWLRVHARAGGVLEKVAPASMTVSGSTEEWRRWTGLAFDVSGPLHVPGALVPVHVEAERGYAVYVEPNVWVRHRL